jgi:hypothetical protein
MALAICINEMLRVEVMGSLAELSKNKRIGITPTGTIRHQ